ncbi:MAG: hypothetical protein M3Q69_15995 [Acidobacteriota bacterium]|nr:hypothetical protein [Acidobacteriota bacterium]
MTLSVTAIGTQLSYQWCSRTENGSWQTMPQTGAQITAAVTSAPMYVQAEVSSGAALRVSEPAMFVLNQKPALRYINAFRVYTGTYRLEAVVQLDEGQSVTYDWYRGPIGNVAASTYLTNYPTPQVAPKPPVTYWVRVTDSVTGCYADASISF